MSEYFWNWNDYTFYLKEENLKLRVLRLAAENEVVQNSENVSPFLKRVCKELSEYFSGMRDCFDIPLILDGTEFQRKVWRELLNVPYGKVVSYKDIAQKIGHVKSVRAVGQACHQNPILLIVPCHRVVGKGGQLGGYAAGVEMKRFLLDLESQHSGQKKFQNSELGFYLSRAYVSE